MGYSIEQGTRTRCGAVRAFLADNSLPDGLAYHTHIPSTLLPRRTQLLKGPLLDAVRGKQVVELGAGTGLAGLCAAALGAHVLLTDLPSIVWSLSENIALNTASTEGGHASGVCGTLCIVVCLTGAPPGHRTSLCYMRVCAMTSARSGCHERPRYYGLLL